MKTYRVGGAVRDELLGLPVKDEDYVVVGATVDDMLREPILSMETRSATSAIAG